MLLKIIGYICNSILDVIFPRSCVLTGDLIEDERFFFISTKNIYLLNFIGEAYCKCCGSPVSSIVSVNSCRCCRERDFIFNQSRSLLILDDYTKRIVYHLKYYDLPKIADDCAELLLSKKEFRDYIFGSVLVPVPLYKKRHFERGYNQSLLLVKAIAKKYTEVDYYDCLERIRDTGTQTRLSVKERQKNVERAFRIKKNQIIDKEKRYIIFDDVFTTGATINECAKILKKAKCEFVDALTFAHG